ncbi:hypothetical protein V2J09_023421 [Rumex salicifolius]
MAPGEKKGEDMYTVLGLGKDCSSTDLKNAYKKLAMRWHPDRYSASGNFRLVEEAKKKFQAIQEAYSVLSDHNKRFLYDVGMYDKEDDDNNNGMGDFLEEMATMMSQTKPSENGQSTFEEFQELFDNVFQSNDTKSFASSSSSSSSKSVRFQNFCK